MGFGSQFEGGAPLLRGVPLGINEKAKMRIAGFFQNHSSTSCRPNILMTSTPFAATR